MLRAESCPEVRERSRRRTTGAAGLALVLGVLVGCGGTDDGAPGGGAQAPTTGTSPADPGLPPAPEPATAPPPVGAPAGRVVPVGSLVEGVVVDGQTGTAAVALRDRRLALLDAGTGAVRSTVNANGTARHLQLARPGGPVLVPGEDSDLLTQLRLPDGVVVASARVGRQPHDAAFDPAAGRVVVADELAGAVSFVEGDRTVAQLPGPVQPGGIAVTDGRAAAIDVRGNTAVVYDVAAAREVARLPFGAGLTHGVVLGPGRVLVADTRGNALFVVALDGTPRVLTRIDFPEGSPYGMAVDLPRQRAYVAASGANVVLPFRITADGGLERSGDPVPTVQQPNSLAVDPRDGTLFVGGATDAGSVQIVRPPSG